VIETVQKQKQEPPKNLEKNKMKEK